MDLLRGAEKKPQKQHCTLIRLIFVILKHMYAVCCGLFYCDQIYFTAYHAVMQYIHSFPSVKLQCVQMYL